MKIDQRIEDIQSKLIKIMTDSNIKTKEEAIRLLGEYGLDTELAIDLFEAFYYAETAKQTSKNVWQSALNSKDGIDYSNDIAKNQQRATDARLYFDSVNSKCAILIVARTLPPNQINDEVLEKLYELEIQEDQINNPAVRISYHYYCENKQNSIDREKLNQFVEKVKISSRGLRRQIAESEKRYESLKRDYINLKHEYSKRIDENETYYQRALSSIKELQAKVNQLQNRGILQVISDKILGKNVSQRRRLPGKKPELPDSLYESSVEKMGLNITIREESSINREQTQVSSGTKKLEENDELQQ